jgi:hypothetical protein
MTIELVLMDDLRKGSYSSPTCLGSLFDLVKVGFSALLVTVLMELPPTTVLLVLPSLLLIEDDRVPDARGPKCQFSRSVLLLFWNFWMTNS